VTWAAHANGTSLAGGESQMLEVARPETRERAHSHPERFTWGIVDAILGLIMLPFGVWMLVIERMVRAVAALGALGER
jgi:membrane-bound ClpP family serine protease